MAELKEMTAEIVAAYLMKTPVPAADLPALIRTVYEGLTRVSDNVAPIASESLHKATPAQIRKSITPEVLTSFEDGKPYRTLKRHLAKRGLTPAEYRTKWGLPDDYPMVSAEYGAKRAALAKRIGLGMQGRGGALGAVEKVKPKAGS